MTDRQDTIADWLALHGTDAATLRAWLAAVVIPPHPSVDPPLPAPATPDVVLAALATALPPLRPTLDRVAAQVTFLLDPDPARFPRAFTLPDDGTGRPLVSCPRHGRASDLLTLAHEIGHACQTLATGPAPLPPVLRETAALIAEAALTRARPDLVPVQAGRLAHNDRHGVALAAALSVPATPYHYRWNYPVAARVALRATQGLSDADLTALIERPAPLPALIARLTPQAA